MRVDRVEIRILRLPLVAHFETSFGRQTDRAFVLVAVHEDSVTGYGECVAMEAPLYSPETVETAWGVLRDHLVPRMLDRAVDHPADVHALFRPVRGHHMAKAALEMAVWDLYAKQQDVPLSRLLGGTRPAIAAGVSIGIQDSLDELVERVGAELAAGYQRVKIKIKPGWDLDAVARVRAAFGPVPLMVDANAAYTLEDADRLVALDEHDLMMIEQPLESDDLRRHALLQQRLRTPLCLDESIESARGAEDALALGACRIINIKPGRLGGHGESRRVHDLCAGAGVPVWQGGMLESGIGRAHNLHLSSLPNFTLPGDVAASRRYYDPDVIEPPIDVKPDGTIDVPTAPGIGVDVVAERVDRATSAHLAIRR